MSPVLPRGQFTALPLLEVRGVYLTLTARSDPRQSVRLSDLINTAGTGIAPGLCKPAFCPDGSGRFVCGTEEQDPARRSKNLLVLGAVDAGSNRLVPGQTASYPVIEVRGSERETGRWWR
jgi:hypothetical protein